MARWIANFKRKENNRRYGVVVRVHFKFRKGAKVDVEGEEGMVDREL